MCDTLVAKRASDGLWFFAKNSDRDTTEPQIIQYVTAQEGLESPTHIEQRSHYNDRQYKTLLKASKGLSLTYPALISRPAWIWGAEMGINSQGVAIGNEAVFSKKAVDKEGLLGMDILRLALHSAATAQAALATIVELIAEWGQGGNGSYSGSLHYHNSFIIADGREAYVLESAGKRWAAYKVEESATISNAYTIEDNYTLGDSETLQKRVNFSQAFASKIHLLFTQGKFRQKTTSSLMQQMEPSFDSMKAALRHNLGGIEDFDHSMRSVCMDAKGVVKSRTTASMIVSWDQATAQVWFTTSPISLYSPFMPFDLKTAQAPFNAVKASYEFTKERMAQTEKLLKAPLHDRLAVHQEALKTEKKLFKGDLDPLVEEKKFRAKVAKILAN